MDTRTAINPQKAPELDLGDDQPVFRFSKLAKDDKIRKAKKLFSEAVSADTDFQREAQEDFAFDAGHQWTVEEKRILEQEQGRPALVFNLCRATKDLILGVNESNKTDVKASPTEPNDDFLCDILNDAADKMYDIAGIENEEDDAFENATVCGRGFVAIDFMPDPKRPLEIKIEAQSVPVHEIRLDPAGKHRPDLSTDRAIFWERWITLEDFAIRYPKHIGELQEILLGERSITDVEGSTQTTTEFLDELDIEKEDSDYDNQLDTDYYDRRKGQIRVIHMEYWDVYDRYYGFNPQTGQVEEFQKDKLPILEKLIPNFQYDKIQDKRIYWYQFAGDIELYDGVSPIPYDGVSIVPCFAYRDKSKKSVSHYGVTRGLKDPQVELNKRWSQTLNLLMKQSQGGYFVETDAYADKDQFESSINAAGETTYLNKGAIVEGKIKEKAIPAFPDAPMRMEEAAQDMMKKISGVNPDLLGIGGSRAEPGIVVRLRQQQGLVVLSRLFKSNKQMKKAIKERIFAIIMKYMPDSQLQRILGGNERYVFRQGLVVDKENGLIAPLRNLRDLKYNVTLEDSPNNMTKTMSQLAIFMEMMGKGFPTDPKVVIEKLDLPSSEKIKWVKYIEQNQQQQSQMAMAQLQTTIQEKQGRIQIEQGRLQLDAQKMQTDQTLKAKQIEQDEVSDKRDYALKLAELNQADQAMVNDLIVRLTSATQGRTKTNAASLKP